MKKTPPPASPDAYVESLAGWQRQCVETLRKAVRAQKGLEEVIKWGHLVYLADGPVLLIRAEPNRVLFGFWQGKHLVEHEPRLKPGGQYDMATLELHEETPVKPAAVRRLVAAALALNQKLGNPQKAAGKAPRRKK
jgi:hypothetical protein